MTCLAPWLLTLALGGAAQPAETVASVVVHGNHTTPTDEVLGLAGAITGQPATDALLAEVRVRLEQSGRFAGVDVRKRYLSIDDPSRVLVVIVVDEHEGISEDDLTGPRLCTSRRSVWWFVRRIMTRLGTACSANG